MAQLEKGDNGVTRFELEIQESIHIVAPGYNHFWLKVRCGASNRTGDLRCTTMLPLKDVANVGENNQKLNFPLTSVRAW